MAHSAKLPHHNCSASYVRALIGVAFCTTVTEANASWEVNACDPQNFEPNLALNLEITDLINSKKGSAYAAGLYISDRPSNFGADQEKLLLQ